MPRGQRAEAGHGARVRDRDGVITVRPATADELLLDGVEGDPRMRAEQHVDVVEREAAHVRLVQLGERLVRHGVPRRDDEEIQQGAGEDARRQRPAGKALAGDEVAEEAADERADDPEQDRHGHAHRVATRHQEAGEEAGEGNHDTDGPLVISDTWMWGLAIPCNMDADCADDGNFCTLDVCDPGAGDADRQRDKAAAQKLERELLDCEKEMRSGGEPDAMPAGDLILLRSASRIIGRTLTARQLDKEAQAWAPWRAYAAMLLWRHHAENPSACA